MSKYAEMFDAEAAAQELAFENEQPSKYAELFDNEVALRQQQTRAIIDRALADDPDIAADRARLSNTAGLPPDLVQRNYEELKRREQARAINLIEMAQQSPVLYRQLVDPNFTPAAIDDLDTLKRIERGFKRNLDYLTDTEQGFVEDVLGTQRSIALGLTVGVGASIFDLAGVVNDLIGWQSGAVGAREQAQRARESMRAFGLQGETSTRQAVRAGLESAGQNIALLPLGLSRQLFTSANQAAAAVAGTMSTFVGAEAYNRAREMGRSQLEAAAFAIPQAGFEYVMERIPASKLFGDIAANEPFLKLLGKQALTEGWTEQVTTLLQDFNEWMNLNPEKTLTQFLAERPEAAYQTLVATLVGVGVQTSAIKGIDTVIRRATDRQLTFEQDLLRQQMELAANSALRTRSPEMFRTHIQRVVDSEEGATKEIYVDAEALNQLPPELLNQLPPDVQAKLPEATATNSTVAIPMADVLTIAPGSDLETFFNDNARIRPNAPTRAEAQLTEDLLAQEADRVLQQAADQEAWAQSSATVRSRILEQLTATGRFSPEVNEAYANLQANFFSTYAARTGMTPEQLYDRFSLRVASAGQARGQVFNAGLGIQFTEDADETTLYGVTATAGNNAFVTSEAKPDGAFLIMESGVPEQDRGQGIGFALYDGLLRNLFGRGAPYVESDRSVSADAQRVYNRLAQAGYDVERNPNATLDAETGALEADGPVYTVRAPAQVAQPTGLAVKPGDIKTSYRGGEIIQKRKFDNDTEIELTVSIDKDDNLASAYLDAGGSGLETDGEVPTGTGTATAMYKNALRWAKDKSVGWISDSILSDQSQRMYERLIEQGIPFELGGLPGYPSQYFLSAEKLATLPDKVLAAKYSSENIDDGMPRLFDLLAAETSPPRSHVPDEVLATDAGDVLAQSVSTRLPTAKKALENPLEDMLIIGLDSAKLDRDAFENNMAQVRQYPNMRPAGRASADTLAERFIQHVVDNLLWLHDQVPADVRDRSRLWYDGARAIVDNWTAKYDLTDAQISAVLAVLSPQKDWFMNVSLGERVLDTMMTKQDFTWDQAMTDKVNEILIKSEEEQKALAEQEDGEYEQVDPSRYYEAIKRIQGKTLREVIDAGNDKDTAVWIRVYDQAYNTRNYRIVSPEGDFLDWKRNNPTAAQAKKGEQGDLGRVAWGSFSEIGKAVSVIRDGSIANISAKLGGQHKVRNFYNNIFDPQSAHGDVTIDTHAVAAALLRPLAGGSLEVKHNFGSGGVSNSSVFGAKGTYGIYAEAYRRAAQQRAILPREMQSITWEAVRGLFQAEQKKALQSTVNAVWRRYRKGEVNIDEARAETLQLANGIRNPDWVGRARGAGETWASSYTEELARSQLPVRGRADGRGAATDTGRDQAAGELTDGQDVLEQAGDGRGRYSSGGLTPLKGAPAIAGATGPDPRLVAVAEQYARDNGIDFSRQGEYAEVDPERAARIAAEYDAMPHAPDDPVVREAFESLILQTRAQYDALVAAGYQFWFIDENNDPYAGNPWNAMRDLRANQSMGVFPTIAGFGSGATDVDISDNPLMADTGIQWPYGSPDGELKPVLANDLFRAVHDAFGHGLEGAGFRAQGEENAWQAHVRLFTGSAVGAITSETRGQNSWLNFGPYGEQNRTAAVEDTIFADQKTGLMPEWTWTEGRVADQQPAQPSRFSPAVLAWAEGTQVVDETGEPQVMYTGTAGDIIEFRPGQAGAIYLSPSPTFASGFAESAARGGEGAANVLPVLARATNVFDPANPEHREGLRTWLTKRYGENGTVVIEAPRVPPMRMTPAQLAERIVSGNWMYVESPVVQEYVREAGHDGFWTTERNVRNLGVFNSNQVKSVFNRAPTEAPGVLEQSAQERDLVVTHNLTAQNLLHAVKMGGIPVPSLAVTRKDSPLTGFGEITLIGDQNLADPRGYARTQVFGADIYSPRYPKTERELDEKAVKALRNEYAPLENELGSRLPDSQTLERDGQHSMERSLVVMAKFLRDQGIEPEITFRPGMNPQRLARLESFGLDAYLDQTDFFDLMQDEGFFQAALAELIDTYASTYGLNYPLVTRLRTDENVQRNLVKDTAREITNAARLRASPDIDTYVSETAMARQIEKADLANQYQQFVADTLVSLTKSERIFQGFTASGRRKYIPHTLENVVKILKKNLRGGETFDYGVGSLRAKFTPQFKSVADIRKNKDRLISEAEFDKVKAEINEEFFALASDINVNVDELSAILEDAIKMGVPQAAAQYDANLSDGRDVRVAEFMNKLRNLPTAYFEAKILREVDLSEFRAAVVPEDVDAKVITALKNAGITDVRTYTRGDEAGRATQIAQFEDLFFQGRQAPLGTFNPQEMMITLGQSANLSTFLHESGHFFLEVLSDLAMDPDAPQQIRDDWMTAMTWGGFTQDQWDQWRAEYQQTNKIAPGMRAFHERWAESFEAYLFEGKAPSTELQPMFRRFRSWLTNVYQSLKSFMQGRNLQINDEIRAVFDRMLATDEQIREAEEAAGLVPEFDATNEAIEQLQARSLRDLRWTIRARAKELKKLEKQAKELRKSVEAQVREEVARQPIYQAMKWLRTGEMIEDGTGDLIKAETGFRLSTEALAEMYPQTMLARPDLSRLRGMTQKDGLHPDLVAEMFGFATGDALVRAIIGAEPMQSVVEGITDQRMLEQHGDLSTPEAREEAANQAVHNEARARSLATELKAQQEMLAARETTDRTDRRGRPITVNALMNAAKQFGATIAGRSKVKELKNAAWQHRAAEARAGKRWQEATSKADTEAAVQAKRDQVLNNAAAKALQEAQVEARKILEFFRKVMRDNDKKLVEKGRDPDVVNAMRAILASYGVVPRLQKSALEYMEVVSRNDPALYVALKPGVDAAVINARPLDQLTMEELRGLHDEMQSMWRMAKRSRQIEIDGKLVDIQELESELMDRMQAIGIPLQVPGETGAITEREELGLKLQFAKSILSRVEQWAERLDGKFGGPFLRYVFQPIKEAADRYRTARVDYRKQFTALLEAVAPQLPAGPIAAPELGYTFGNARDSGAAELLHAILHTGNGSNKRKLLLGRGWASENPDGTLNTGPLPDGRQGWDAFVQRMHDEGKLNKTHYDFAQGVWDLLEQMKPLAQRAHRDVFGRYFAEVTADGFVTPFGTYRGGYVPAQTDTRLVKDARLRELAEGENEGMAYAFPAAPSGFTKSRVEYNKPLLLDLRALGQHMDKVLLFSYMQPAVNDVRRLLTRKGVSQALDRIDPGAYEGMLIPWLNRSARQVVETPVMGDRKISRFLSAMRARAGMALMFANLSNTAQQITGFTLAAVKVRPGLMLDAAALFIRGPKEFKRQVAQASPFMKDRMLNEVSALNDVVEQILVNPTWLERGREWTQQHAYFLQAAVDNIMSPIIWTAAYNQAIKDNFNNQDAIRFADGVIRQTQGTTLPEDISRFESGPAVARLFTQFVSYFNMMANTNATAVKQIVDEMGMKKGAGRLLYVALAGLLAPIWVAEAIAIAFRGGPEDEDDDGYLDDWMAAVFGLGTVRGLLAQVPIVGQAAQLAVNRINDNPADDKFSLSPAVSLIESAVGSPVSVYKAIIDEGSAQKAARDVAAAATLITGLPIYGIQRPIGYAAGVAQGRIEPLGPVDLTRGLVTGTASPESRAP